MSKITMNCSKFRESFPFLLPAKGKRLTFEGMNKKVMKHQQEIARALIKIGYKVFVKYNTDRGAIQVLDVNGYTASMQPLYTIHRPLIIHWLTVWQ